MFVAASVGLSWPGITGGGSLNDGPHPRIAYNLALHGVFHAAYAWSPDAGPYMDKDPGHSVFIALVLATIPSFPEVPRNCVLDPLCAPGAPLRERYRQAEMALVGTTVGAIFLVALALTRSWPLALAAGTAALALIPNNSSGHTLAGLLLLAHTVLAWRAWKRPRAATGALAGLALGLAVLTEAALLYWLPVLAALCAAGLWREADRRRPLAGAVAAMLLAASLPAGLWMARNHAVAGQFAVSGRSSEILAVRAEYAQATWPEIRGMLAYYLPTRHIWRASVLKKLAMERLLPETFGYTRLWNRYESRPNLAAFYPRTWPAFADPQSSKASHSVTAKRADLLAPGWRKRPKHERDPVLRRAALQLIRENWPKHLAVSASMALFGMDHRCRLYSGLYAASRVTRVGSKGLCIASKALSLTFVPAALAMLVLAARRRDTALALLVLPAVHFFVFLALATHFVPRLTLPIMPLLIVVAALAANECLRWRAARTGDPRSRARASAPRPAGGRTDAGPTPDAAGRARSPSALP